MDFRSPNEMLRQWQRQHGVHPHVPRADCAKFVSAVTVVALHTRGAGGCLWGDQAGGAQACRVVVGGAAALAVTARAKTEAVVAFGAVGQAGRPAAAITRPGRVVGDAAMRDGAQVTGVMAHSNTARVLHDGVQAKEAGAGAGGRGDGGVVTWQDQSPTCVRGSSATQQQVTLDVRQGQAGREGVGGGFSVRNSGGYTTPARAGTTPQNLAQISAARNTSLHLDTTTLRRDLHRRISVSGLLSQRDEGFRV